MPAQPIAIDLFAGAGGVTAGYKAAGVKVVAAVEFDPVAAKTYRENHPEVRLYERDIRQLAAVKMLRDLNGRQLDILTSCSPCQSFSTLFRGKRDSTRKDLALTFLRFASVLKPRAVVIENVPRLARDGRFQVILRRLKKLGYSTWWSVIDAADYGVPQTRKRLVLVGLEGKTTPSALAKARVERTVRSAIGAPPGPGELNRARDLKPIVRQRLAAVPPGGGRRDLPDELVLECHKRLRETAATAIYGRMTWDDVAPTLTTRCTTPACGRFGHPDQPRPITLREAACLQTFPRRYRFQGTRMEIERQIGNAVPVELARRIARHVRRHLAARPPSSTA